MSIGVQRTLAFTALQRHAVTRSQIAGTLWPETTEERARANLRTSIWRVKEVGVPILATTRDQIALSDCVKVDLHEMNTAALALESGSPDGDYPGIERLLSHELLPGWYDEWVTVDRERSRNMQLQALETLAEKRRLSGQLAESENALLAAVGLEPLKESNQLKLIQVIAGQGNRGQALRRYEAYRSLLMDELGIEPSPPLESFLNQCVR